MALSRNRAVRGAANALMAAALISGAAMSSAHARTLAYASSSPPTDIAANRVLNWWADQIKACTNGSTTIKVHYMGSLVKLKDALEGVSSGIADIAYLSPAYTSAKLPLWYSANSLYGPGDQYTAIEAFRRVRERMPEIKAEEKKNNLHYISHLSNGPQVLISSSRPYVTPADFKGDKVRLPGIFANVARKAGWDVGPVSLPFADIYSAMERGTIDGAMTYVPLIEPYSHNEVSKYVVEPRVGQNTNAIFMNLNTWNSLSDKDKQCFNQFEDELRLRFAQEGMKDEAKFREVLKNHPKNPLKFYQLNDEQRKPWVEGAEIGAEEKVQMLSKYTKFAKKLDDLYREELANVEKEVAEKGFPWDRN